MNDATLHRNWRTEVVVVRRAADTLKERLANSGRSTLFDFKGLGGAQMTGATWIGAVTIPPKLATGLHHHGRHEVALYIISGKALIRWGERLEFGAELHPGDCAYFPPYVPHQEENPDPAVPVEAIAIRSDNERIAVKLPNAIADKPEMVA